MGNRKRFGILALCALAGSSVAMMAPPPAAAAEPGSITVSYRDLQLSRPSDVRILYARLQRAAARVCEAPSPFELERYAAFKYCVQVTVKDAVVRINAPGLESTVAELNRAGGEYAWAAQARR